MPRTGLRSPFSDSSPINNELPNSSCLSCPLAAKIAKQAPLAIRVIKQSIKSIHETTLSQGLKFNVKTLSGWRLQKIETKGLMLSLRKESQCLEVSDGLSKYYC